VLDALGEGIHQGGPASLTVGKGCVRCGGRGMKGRSGSYEILPMSDALRRMTLKGASAQELKDQAIAEGMVTMRSAAFRKMLAGQTTFEEVTRVLFTDGE